MLMHPDIDPVIITIGNISIYWYSIAYVAGILLGWLYINKLIDKCHIKSVTQKHINDFINWAIIGIIIGGRLGYVIFYDFARYLAQPIDVLKIYEGGMSFHGGVIGYILATYFFAKKYKIKFLQLLDLSAAAAPIGIFLGRIANFINAELYGRITDVPWSFIFPNSDYMPRHPSQLYEAALEGLLLFCILLYYITKGSLSNKGFVSGLFLVFYSIFRVVLEFFREPDIQIGFIGNCFTMGQCLTIPMFVIGGYFILFSKKQSAEHIS